jgi:hypothetical protein
VTRSGRSIEAVRLAALAVILLVGGVVVVGGVAPAGRREAKRLAAERVERLKKVQQSSQDEREVRELARRLGAEDLATGLAALRDTDPLSRLAEGLDRSRLIRLELGSQPSEIVGTVFRTRYSLRVQGSYAHILDFLRLLEQDALPLAVDALSIAQVPDSPMLEARFDLSVYSPGGGP